MQKQLSKTQRLIGLKSAACFDSLATIKVLLKQTCLTQDDLTQIADIAVSDWSVQTLLYFMQNYASLLNQHVLSYLEKICCEDNSGSIFGGVHGRVFWMPENCTVMMKYLDSLTPGLHPNDTTVSGVYQHCLDNVVRRICTYDPNESREIPESLITWLIHKKCVISLTVQKARPRTMPKRLGFVLHTRRHWMS